MIGWAAALLTVTAAAPAPVSSPTVSPEVSRRRAECWLENLRGLGTGLQRGLTQRSSAPASGAKGDIREVYKKVAPGTVLIRTPNGFGTGIVVDPRGYVLTNHHVIAGAESIDFKQRVFVELGHLDASGVMEKDGKSHTAWVLKSDPLVDLAVVKLDDPPANLTVVKLSEKDPVPGEPVSALGNGAIGLLWAIKDGEIASIGRLSTHLAMLVGAECQVSADPAVNQACKQSRQSLEAERKVFAEQVPGLVIQSSCPISPGDSGGPLVNRAGELVGVNAFLRTDASAPVATNFHVHLQEVKTFLAQVPPEPKPKLPSPWEGLKPPAQWVDADLDGTFETLVAPATEGTTVLIDLGAPPTGPIDPNQAIIDRSFPVDLALTRSAKRLIAFIDTQHAGRFDRIAISTGGFDHAEQYRVGADGQLEHLPEGRLIDPSLFDKSRAARWSALAPLALQSLGFFVPVDLSTPPNPWAVGGPHLTLRDLDGDGKADALVADSISASAIFLDVDRKWLPQTDLTRAAQSLTQHTPATRIAFVERGVNVWAFVDVDGDGHFDTVMATQQSGGGVTAAWNVGSTGERGEARPDLIGTLIDAPNWAHLDNLARDRRTLLEQMLRLPFASSGRGVIGMPHPSFDTGSQVVVEKSLPKSDHLVVTVTDPGGKGASVLFDLAHPNPSPFKPAEVERQVRQGASNVDFALVTRGLQSWLLYDTDDHGGFDTVCFISDGVNHWLTLDHGAWKVDPIDHGPKAVVPGLFKNPKAAAALRAMAPSYFTSDWYGE